MDNMEYSYLNEAGIANVIPSNSTYSEDAMYTIASIEESYANMIKNIGVIELDAVMEADGFSIKKLWEKFKNWVRDLWEKFVELVKTARDRIAYFVINKFKFFKDKKLSAASIAKAVENDVKKDKVKSSNRWKKYVGTYYMFDINAAKSIAAGINGVMKDTTKAVKSLKASSSYEKMTDKQAVLQAMMLKEALGVAENKIMGMSQQDIKLEITKKVSTTKEITDPAKFVIENAATLWKNLENSKKKFDETIKDPYKKCKADLDKAVKDAKRIVDTTEFKPLFGVVAAGSKAYSATIGGLEEAYIKSIVWQFKLLHAGASLVNISESASFDEFDMTGQSTTFQTELSSLWDF